MALRLNTQSLALPVAETSDVGEARRRAVMAARDIGLAENALSDFGILVTEAANNLVRHGTGGEIVLRAVGSDAARGLELLILDKGPGMSEIARCMQDGFSTGGTAGTGLGAMRRLATEFDVHSVVGIGTAILARYWKDGARPARKNWEVGAVCIPARGETECGDAWSVVATADRLSVLVADGLGHGPLAAEASLEAVRVFEQTAGKGALGALDAIHLALRKTRGAAAAITSIDWAAGEARFAGVGNISGFLFSGEKRQGLTSSNGIVGHELRSLKEFTYPLAGFRSLVLHSDGIATRWSLDDAKYPGLAARDPALIAGVLYRDFMRGKDDATCVVLQYGVSRG